MPTCCRPAVSSLLHRLRYPSPSMHGVAAWGPCPLTGREHAWVKWDGKTLAAEVAVRASSSSPPQAASLRWEPSSMPVESISGPSLGEVLSGFESIRFSELPSFVAIPPA